MSIKLVAIDMDGTLLNEHSELNPYTIEVVKQAKAKGIKIVIATGRPLIGVQRFLDKMDLNELGDYVVTYNGALVQASHDGSVIVHHTLNQKDYMAIEYLARQIGVHMHAEDDQFIYTANRDLSMYTIGESYLLNMPVRYRAVDEMTKDMTYSKFMMIDDPKVLDAAAENIPADMLTNYHFVKSMPYFLEVLNKKASKGNGLADLATHLGLTADNVMAIGDQGNDISMLEYAGTAVAMGNATDEVKSLSDFVTDTNIEDGVAKAIVKYAF